MLCLCQTWLCHSVTDAKSKRKRVFTHWVIWTTLQYSTVCYQDVATCMNHSELASHPDAHPHTLTKLILCTWRLGAAEFYGGIRLLYPSFTCPVGPHSSSQISSVPLSHADTIKCGPSSLLFRALKTDERSKRHNSAQCSLGPTVVPAWGTKSTFFYFFFFRGQI